MHQRAIEYHCTIHPVRNHTLLYTSSYPIRVTLLLLFRLLRRQPGQQSGRLAVELLKVKFGRHLLQPDSQAAATAVLLLLIIIISALPVPVAASMLRSTDRRCYAWSASCRRSGRSAVRSRLLLLLPPPLLPLLLPSIDKPKVDVHSRFIRVRGDRLRARCVVALIHPCVPQWVVVKQCWQLCSQLRSDLQNQFCPETAGQGCADVCAQAYSSGRDNAIRSVSVVLPNGMAAQGAHSTAQHSNAGIVADQ